MSLSVRLLRRLIALNMTKSPLVVVDVYHRSIICFKSAFEGFLYVCIKDCINVSGTY